MRPSNQAGVTFASVSFSRVLWVSMGSPDKVRVEPDGDGALSIVAATTGVKVTPNGRRSVQASCSGHGTRPGRRPVRLLDGWFLEVEPGVDGGVTDVAGG